MLNMRTSVFAEYVNVCINVYKKLSHLWRRFRNREQTEHNQANRGTQTVLCLKGVTWFSYLPNFNIIRGAGFDNILCVLLGIKPASYISRLQRSLNGVPIIRLPSSKTSSFIMDCLAFTEYCQRNNLLLRYPIH